jgi:hypothetical protein
MSGNGFRSFLKIVGRQPMVRSGDEGFEKTPSAPRNQSKGAGVSGRQLACSMGSGRQADPPRQGRSSSPKDDEWKRGEASLVSSQGHCDDDGHHQQNSTTHAPVDRGQLGIGCKPGLGCRHPFEQIPVGEKQTPESPQNRVGHQPCLVGEEGERQADLRSAEC